MMVVKAGTTGQSAENKQAYHSWDSSTTPLSQGTETISEEEAKGLRDESIGSDKKCLPGMTGLLC